MKHLLFGPRSRAGVTLIEAVIVIGLIGVLVGLLLPAVNNVRGSAARIGCQNNLKEIGLALHHYHDVNGQLPQSPPKPPIENDPNEILGWMALILPYLEQNDLYDISIKACLENTDPLNNPPHLGFSTVVKPYVCPSDNRLKVPLRDQDGIMAAYASYIGIVAAYHPGSTTALMGVLCPPPGTRFEQITDGLSSTIMVGERPPPNSLQAGWWYPVYMGYGINFIGPNNHIILGGVTLSQGDPCKSIQGTLGPGNLDNPCDRFHLWSLHQGGANFLFVDGSVRFLPYSTPSSTILALASRSGGEVVELP